MKIRNIPFGYEVVGGRYVVNNGEAEIISSIYDMYLSGKTLLGIAKALTEQEVTYFEDTKVWNKNMVSRTGNDSVLDVYAIENQIQSYYDQMSILLDRLYSTGGEAEKYELEIKKINDKIAALREQLSTEKAKATSSDDLNREVERILNYIAQTDKDTFVEYDDVTVRRLVECITVSNDRRIVVTLKGGFRGEEII